MVSKRRINYIEIVSLENEQLVVSLAPALGGKIVSIYNKRLAKEFLWINKNRAFERLVPGSDYDSNFFGGIDELLPNDIPETIDGIAYSDHGELWTTALDYQLTEETILVFGTLPRSGLFYQKKVSLEKDASLITLHYTIRNDSAAQRHFMWKLHAAVTIEAGSKLITLAKRGVVADPEYTRFKNQLTDFDWPVIEGTDASLIPPQNNTMDFFYLYDMPAGEMRLQSCDGEHTFAYLYDKAVFPFQWLFATYGGFHNHYTAILEPCTNMPISVNEAKAKNQCATLAPGESLETVVQIFAGETKKFMH